MAKLPRRSLGSTGVEVSILGLGGGTIGDETIEDERVARLLHAAVDFGVTLFDTARSYGASEDRIGRHLADRRADVVYSTKLGYGIDGVPDWTGPSIDAGVDAALERLRTDYIDIVHLHSCPRDVLERGEVIGALDRAVQAGKVRAAAYSGDNDPLQWAARSGRFGSIQTSVSVCDQWSLRQVLPIAVEKGIGVIAKRPLSNAFWRFGERPHGDYCELYWTRWQAMAGDLDGLDPSEVALRFTAYAPGVSACIAGTTNEDHLRRNVEQVAAGALPAADVERIRGAFERHGADWPGDI